MLNYLYFFFEGLAFIVAALQFRKLRHTPFFYFVPYLFFILVYEYGSVKRWFGINGSNLWISNITLLIFFLVYSLILLKLIRTPLYKKWIRAAIVFAAFCYVVNNAFFQGFWNFNSITVLLQYFILIVITCLYFYELMNYTHVQLSIVSSPGFWLNTGLLFFCLVYFLFYASFTFLAYQRLQAYILLFRIVANLASAILYSCLTVSFLCLRKVNSSF